MGSVEIVEYEALDPEFYQERVRNLFYAAPWLRVLANTYGYQFHTAVDRSTDQFIIFTVVEHFVGRKVISLPFSDYTEIHSEAGARLLSAIQKQYPTLPVVLKTTLTDAAALGQPIRNAYYHRIDTQEAGQAQQRRSSSFKRGVKKAQRAGVKAVLKQDETALKAFYAMYHQLRIHKFNSIPQPYAFFLEIFKVFIAHDQGFILQAEHQEQVIASIVVLQHQDILYYKFGCSLEASLDMRPNNLIFDTLIGYAQQHQFKAIDLGLSGAGASYEGLVRFKESMGGVRKDITYFRSDPPGYDGQAEKEFKRLLSSLTQVIVEQEPDVAATDRFSEFLYPFFA